jgi:hypothetical protein
VLWQHVFQFVVCVLSALQRATQSHAARPSVLFVCKRVLYDCHRVATQMQLNVSYHISYHITSYTISYHISTSQSREPTRVECYEQLREFYQYAKWSYIKMHDRKPENQVRGCSRWLVQSVPSADPWGTPPTRLKGPGLHLCSFTHTAGVRRSPGMRPTFILYTQQASKAVRQERCCAQNVNLTKNSQQLTSASFTYTLYDNSTKQPPSKSNFSAGRQFQSFFLLFESSPKVNSVFTRAQNRNIVVGVATRL